MKKNILYFHSVSQGQVPLLWVSSQIVSVNSFSICHIHIQWILSTFLDILLVRIAKKEELKQLPKKSCVLISQLSRHLSHKLGSPAGEAVRAPEAVQGNGAASYGVSRVYSYKKISNPCDVCNWYWSEYMCYLGKDGVSKTDEFSEKFQKKKGGGHFQSKNLYCRFWTFK